MPRVLHHDKMEITLFAGQMTLVRHILEILREALEINVGARQRIDILIPNEVPRPPIPPALKIRHAGRVPSLPRIFIPYKRDDVATVVLLKVPLGRLVKARRAGKPLEAVPPLVPVLAVLLHDVGLA